MSIARAAHGEGSIAADCRVIATHMLGYLFDLGEWNQTVAEALAEREMSETPACCTILPQG